jgi:phage baseplate assembly protein W
MEQQNKAFLGRGWGFPPTFHKEFKGVDMLETEADIESSLFILLKTQVGERIMQPNYGCNLTPFIFEPLNIATKTMIEKIVNDAVTLNEPRIIADKITIDFTDPEGRIDIAIEYRIITTNTRYNYVFPFYLNEATNLTR